MFVILSKERVLNTEINHKVRCRDCGSSICVAGSVGSVLRAFVKNHRRPMVQRQRAAACMGGPQHTPTPGHRRAEGAR